MLKVTILRRFSIFFLHYLFSFALSNYVDRESIRYLLSWESGLVITVKWKRVKFALAILSRLYFRPYLSNLISSWQQAMSQVVKRSKKLNNKNCERYFPFVSIR